MGRATPLLLLLLLALCASAGAHSSRRERGQRLHRAKMTTTAPSAAPDASVNATLATRTHGSAHPRALLQGGADAPPAPVERVPITPIVTPQPPAAAPQRGNVALRNLAVALFGLSGTLFVGAGAWAAFCPAP